MSILTRLSRYATDYRARRRQAQTYAHVTSLPREIQKDIGWPDAYRPSRQTGRGRSG